MIKPESFMCDSFGLDKEILLVYSPFSTLEARALQAANMLFKRYPYMNRIDTLNFFFVSRDSNIQSYAGIMSFSEEESRSIVPFVYDELISNVSDNWYIRKVLKRNFYDVDLFGYMLPLRDELSSQRLRNFTVITGVPTQRMSSIRMSSVLLSSNEY